MKEATSRPTDTSSKTTRSAEALAEERELSSAFLEQLSPIAESGEVGREDTRPRSVQEVLERSVSDSSHRRYQAFSSTPHYNYYDLSKHKGPGLLIFQNRAQTAGNIE